ASSSSVDDTHAGAGHATLPVHAPAPQPTSHEHAGPQSTIVQLPDAAQLIEHAPVPPPASSPCIGEKPIRSQLASAIRSSSERRSKTVSPKRPHQGKAPEILRG